MTTLSVVIPAYNEENGIEEIVRRVLAIKPALQEVGVDDLELIVVDDGSSDRTAEIAGAIEGVNLIRQENKGYGGALKTGFSHAKGELIGFLDADGTYPPEYFPKLCIPALEQADLVIGSRRAGEESHMPLTRRLGNFFFATLLSILSRQKVSDSASGQRVFKRKIYEQMLPLPDGLNLTPVQSARALHENMKVVEVPISYSERLGRSKLSVVHDGRIFLQSMLWTVMMYNPVRIFGLIGLGGIAIAALAFFALLIARLSGSTTLGPWGISGIFISAISGVAGVSLYSLGVTFNRLVMLFNRKSIPRQGMFGGLIFKESPDRYFGLAGLGSFFFGVLLGLVALGLGFSGWDITRQWLYLLGSSMLILIGVQLMTSWALVQVLKEISQREELSRQDMDAPITPQKG
ncbi:MAG TPA: glycosyltransferase family 2 protein [Anaerolineales bacterium]|nr:glycosyltransferase family 2 protein [Anaerolineales bacterium]